MAAKHQQTSRVRVWTGPFCGARLLLKPSISRRKILGVYESENNDWLRLALPLVNVVWDIGANDGYFTYGCAEALQRASKRPKILAFEPDLANHPDLHVPAKWPQYRNAEFAFIDKCVGDHPDANTTTVDEYARENSSFVGEGPSLFKVDVEGAEVSVLRGAGDFLDPPHHWLVEIHSPANLDDTRRIFGSRGRKIETHMSKPHWLFGPEQRPVHTCWVVTVLQ